MTLLALAVLVAGCPGALSERDRFLRPTCSLALDVEQDLFVPTCGRAGCHVAGTNAAAGLDLVSPGPASRMTGLPGTGCDGRPLIDPDDPLSSALIDRLTEQPECGLRMPLSGDPLSPDEVNCVRAWVVDSIAGSAALMVESW